MADPSVSEIKRVVSATVRDSVGGYVRDIQRSRPPDVSKSINEIRGSLAGIESRLEALNEQLQEIDLKLYTDHSLAERINLLTQSIRFQNHALDAMSKRLDRLDRNRSRERQELVK